MIAKQTWTNSQFKRAGNIVCFPIAGQQRLFVFDGYRTVVEMDTDGKILSRHELQLPENEAVGVLRAGFGETGQIAYAAFMPLGDAVYVFDEHWQLISSYPPVAGKGIRDAQLTSGGTMLVAFEGTDGIHGVEIPLLKGNKIYDLNASSLNRSGLDAICNGSLLQLSSGKQNSEFAAWQLSRFGNSQGTASCCLGNAKDGSWQVIGLDGESVGWTAPIGPQMFDNNIEPIASTAGPTPSWAVANSNGMIHVFNHRGSWLGDFQSDAELLGLALVEEAGQLRLIVSTERGVTNWNLDVAEAAARAAANQER